MTRQLVPKSHFIRRLKKIRQKSSSLRTRIERTLELLQQDMFDPKLKTHKVIAHYDQKIAYASLVTGDIRIIWRLYNGNFDLIDLIDIGSHSGNSKVYQ